MSIVRKEDLFLLSQRRKSTGVVEEENLSGSKTHFY